MEALKLVQNGVDHCSTLQVYGAGGVVRLIHLTLGTLILMSHYTTHTIKIDTIIAP